MQSKHSNLLYMTLLLGLELHWIQNLPVSGSFYAGFTIWVCVFACVDVCGCERAWRNLKSLWVLSPVTIKSCGSYSRLIWDGFSFVRWYDAEKYCSTSRSSTLLAAVMLRLLLPSDMANFLFLLTQRLEDGMKRAAQIHLFSIDKHTSLQNSRKKSECPLL